MAPRQKLAKTQLGWAGSLTGWRQVLIAIAGIGPKAVHAIRFYGNDTGKLVTSRGCACRVLSHVIWGEERG